MLNLIEIECFKRGKGFLRLDGEKSGHVIIIMIVDEDIFVEIKCK